MQATEYYGILTFVSTNDKGVYSTLPSNSQKTWSAHFLASAKNEDEDPLRSEFYFNGKRTKFLPKTTFKYVWEETVHHKNEKYSSAVERLKQFELASASEETKLQEQSSILSKNKQELESSQKVIGDELSKTINRLNDLTKGNQEKLRNLEIVKKELESKQSELVPLQDILARKTAIYEELKAKVTQAQESVSRAEEDLKNLNTQLEQMKSELKSLQQADEDYTKAKSNLELVQKKLEDAQEKLKQDLLLLTALKSELQQKSLLLDECELKDDAKLDDLIYIPSTSNKPQNKSVNATNKVEQLVISKKRDNRVTGLKTVAPKETLPHTGEANSYLTVAGISMMATLSLVSTKKRKKSS